LSTSLFKPGTKRYIIAALHAAGLTKREAYSELRAKVAAQEKPWVFTANVPGQGRRPKALSDQFVELQHEVNRVYAVIARSGDYKKDAPGDQPEKVEIPDVPETEIETPDETEEDTEDEKPEPPRAKGKIEKRTRDDEKAFFVSEWKRLRRWIAEIVERNSTIPLDSLDSMRPIIAARSLIDAGISARALIYSMCIHWPQASREMAGVETVDFLTESEDLGEGFHRLAGYVKRLAETKVIDPYSGRESRNSIMLIGPAGTGKSHLAKQVAGLIRTDAHPNGLPYGETPLTPGATRGDLLGRHTVSGFIPSQFVEIYSGGGVFNFEEIDAADPSMLIVVNNALSSDSLFNSANGERYERHPDFIAIGTANTFGLGSDSKYTGREKLDLATIDRFRMCRVLVTLDESLADSLMYHEMSK
jgi:hypothetical protein